MIQEADHGYNVLEPSLPQKNDGAGVDHISDPQNNEIRARSDCPADMIVTVPGQPVVSGRLHTELVPAHGAAESVVDADADRRRSIQSISDVCFLGKRVRVDGIN